MFLTRTRQVVGLDIGSHAIKMVALRPAKGDLPFELTHFGLAELPGDTVVDGSLAEPAVVTETLADLFAQHKLRTRLVATSVSGNAVILRRVTVRRMSPEDLRAELPHEAEAHIPFDTDEVDLDFAILAEDEAEETMDVVFVAAKRERVDEYVDAIEAAKLTATVMDVDAFAVQNAFEYSYPERQFEDIAILNIGASVINLAVLEGGRPAFWRDITTGVRQYTQALERHFMLDALDAEDLFRRVCRSDSNASPGAGSPDLGLAAWSGEGEGGAQLEDVAADPRVLQVIGEVSTRIANEVKKTFDFYEAQAMREHFDCVFMAGGGAHVPDLARRLEERLGWPVERFDAMRRIAVPEKDFDPEYVFAIGPQSIVALGLALRGVTE